MGLTVRLGRAPELWLGPQARAIEQGPVLCRVMLFTANASFGPHGRCSCLLVLRAHVDPYRRQAGSRSTVTGAADTLSQGITFQLIMLSFISPVHLW